MILINDVVVQHGDESIASLLNTADLSLEVTRHFSSVAVNRQGQLCVRLNRPIAFAESLVQVAEMGSKYGSFVSPPLSMTSSRSTVEKESILLLNDAMALRHLADSGCGLGESGRGLSMSEGRSLLLVGVLANLLRCSGHAVYQHHYNWPTVSPSYGVSKCPYLEYSYY